MSISDLLRRLAGPDPALAEARQRAHDAEVAAAEQQTRADLLARKLTAASAETVAKVAAANRERDGARTERDAALADVVQVRREWGADRRELLDEIGRLSVAHDRVARRLETYRDVEPHRSTAATRSGSGTRMRPPG